jgi:hypothetical protein
MDAAARKARDPRLDFFRGVAMLIIYVAHMPDNGWSDWIPARFGPSDATEMFVFCSGFAAAIAFGGTFRRAGFATGTARILHRCWQLYWCHLALFLAVAALVAWATAAGAGTRDYVGFLNLHPFLERPAEGIVGLVTLTYVPNYFDILPMYMVVLGLMAPAVLLARFDPRLAVAASLAVYAAAWAGLSIPAEPWGDRRWFFNPFGWQFLFFLGFAISSGWIRAPRFGDRRLVALSAAYVALMFALAHWPIVSSSPLLLAMHDAIWGNPGFKTDLHPARVVHFLALAYLLLSLLEGRVELLTRAWAAPVVKIGQQALPTFLASMWLAMAAGIALDAAGRSAGSLFVANVGGAVVLYAVAVVAGFFKTQPWKSTPRPTPAASQVPAAEARPPADLAVRRG